MTVSFTVRNTSELFKPVLPVVKNVDPTLPGLQFAKVYVTGSSVHAVACDRYTLVESKEDVDGNQSGVMFLPLNVVTILARKRGIGMVTYALDGTRATVTIDDGEQSFTFDDMSNSFPTLERLPEKAFESRHREATLPPVLSSVTFGVLAAVAKAAGKHAHLRFAGTDHVNPTFAVEVSDTVRLMVMGSRDDGSQVFSTWSPLFEIATAAQAGDATAAA